MLALSLYCVLFQSTLPMKGATEPSFHMVAMQTVSIHAPNEGSDIVAMRPELAVKFQSTLPMKGATAQSVIIDGV